MGYSIYDYYGMANDLQNRYEASKNAGRSATTGVTGLSFNMPNNAPFKQQTTAPTPMNVPTQQRQSIYDAGGNETSTSGADITYQAGGNELSKGGQNLLMGITTAFNPFGPLITQAMNMAGVGGSNSKLGGVAKMAGGYGLSKAGLGPFGVPAKIAFNTIIDLLTGNFTSPTLKANTMGDMEKDPFSAIAPNPNTIGNPEDDPYAWMGGFGPADTDTGYNAPFGRYGGQSDDAFNQVVNEAGKSGGDDGGFTSSGEGAGEVPGDTYSAW